MSTLWPTSDEIRVAIIEDRLEIREGLRMLLSATPGFRCTGAYGSMEVALELLPAAIPDAVLTDIGLPGMSGLDGIPLMRQRFPSVAIVMLTIYEDDDRIFDSLCAGACGYLLKKTPPVKLLDGIREAVCGGAPMSPEIARRVVTLFRDVRPPKHADYELTPHETRLLKLLVDGHNCTTAASELGVTVHAVSYHMRRIYEKLEVHSKSEAVAKVLKERLID